jgi:aspartyl-tRNA(Asn)/glutamyl-tRNA(Gln) amidotransferase subunit A
MDEVLDLDLCAAADLVARREVSASELAAAAIARTESDPEARKCFIRFEPEQALAQAVRFDGRANGAAKHPLGGVPLAHKDLFALPGRRVSFAAHEAFHLQGETTAQSLVALDQAGAVNLGGLHLSEFAMGPAGWTPHYGFLANPRNPAQVTGGSSSGSAAAVARGLAYASLGTDTGGSIRIPSAFCEVVGLKPSTGLVPTQGCFSVSESLDVVGPIARSATDCARMLDALTGTNPAQGYEQALTAEPSLRFGFLSPASLPVAPDASVAAAYQAAITHLTGAGFALREVELANLADLGALCGVVFLTEAAAAHGERLTAARELIGAQVAERLLQGLAYPGALYLLARRARERHLAELRHTLFAAVDVLLLPTSPCLPPRRTDYEVMADTGTILEFNGRVGAYTGAFSYLGLPALSLPFHNGAASQRGFGLQMVADHGRDAVLLQAARATEVARDG